MVRVRPALAVLLDDDAVEAAPDTEAS